MLCVLFHYFFFPVSEMNTRLDLSLELDVRCLLSSDTAEMEAQDMARSIGTLKGWLQGGSQSAAGQGGVLCYL